MITNLKLSDGSTINRAVWVKNGVSQEIATIGFGSNSGTPTPPPPPPPSGTPSAGLSFDLTPLLQSTSPKKVFAHYFPPFPRSLDNLDPSADYYKNGYLNIHGESNGHQSYGGYLRNRPMGRAPLSGDYTTEDIQAEIDNARAFGIQGFFVDMLSSSASSTNTTRAMHLIAVASSYVPDGSFKVVPMVDTTASLTTGLTTDQLSDRIASYSGQASSWYLDDGRFVVSSFKGETYNAAWWDTLFQNMKTRHGLNVAFLAGLLNISTWSNYQGYSWFYGCGDWGDGADPGIAAATGASDHSIGPRNAGLKWMQPVQGENVRPDQHVYDEAQGLAALRGWMDRVLRNGADYIQVVTWSDWSESGSVAQSVNSSNVNLQLLSWYLYQWKLGQTPTILRDEILLSHRSHTKGATFRSGADGETTFMSHWARGTGMGPVVDIVDVTLFLTTSAQVTVTIGGTPVTWTAPAGMSTHQVPLLVGTPSVSIARAGTTVATLTSTVPVVSNQYKDEWVYYRFSLLQGTSGQFNPNLA